MSLRRKVFVLNATEDAHANIVSASATNPFEAIVDGSPRELICAWLAKGFTYKAIDAVAEQVKVVLFTMSGDLIANTKYSLVRTANPEYLKGRDANTLGNQQVYSYTTPAVISVQATTKEAMAVSFIAQVLADHAQNHAVVTSAGNGTTFTVTEDAGYGLSNDYPGPAFWNIVQVATEIVATSSALGYKAVGDGDEMLFNKAVWTPDGKWIRSGLEKYNFDKTLPLAGKTYTTFIISAKYPMQDHDQTVPDLTDEIILYADDTSAYDHTLKTQLDADVIANA